MKEARTEVRKKLLVLAAPIVIQNLLSSAVNSMDVIMLNFVGQDAISAVSLAAQVANVLFMILYGAGTGATMLNAQYYGKGDIEAVKVVQGIAMRFSLGAAALVAAAAFFLPEAVMRIFTDDAALVTLGAQYLRIVGVAYLCWGVIEVYLSVLRSIGRVNVSMGLNVLAFSLNILLNAGFIFGWFGLPKMGIAGVALATSLSRVVELIGCLIVSAGSEIKLDLRYMLIRNKVLFDDFIKMALPAIFNDVVWGLAFTLYSVVLGHLGSDAVAANSLGSVVRNFGSVLCFGMSSATGIAVGQTIGEGDENKARLAASEALRLTFLSCAIGGAIILCVTPFVLRFADLSEMALHYLKYMLLINSVYIFGGGVNTTLIVGVIRAGGDSRFGLIVDMIDMWVYALPLAFLNAFVFKLPVLWVYLFMCTDEFVKWPWVFRHYFSGKWLKNITRDNWNS